MRRAVKCLPALTSVSWKIQACEAAAAWCMRPTAPSEKYWRKSVYTAVHFSPAPVLLSDLCISLRIPCEALLHGMFNR